MSFISYKLNWPSINGEEVCREQNVVVLLNANLILNGTLNDPFEPNSISFIKNGFIRSVSFTSDNDLSAATFTIVGRQNNAVISENVTGPNADSVESLEKFDIITSITVNINVAGIKVGLGGAGFLPLMAVNTKGDNSYLNYGIQVSPKGVKYGVGATFLNLLNDGITLKAHLEAGDIIAFEEDQDEDKFFSYNEVTNYLVVLIQEQESPPGALSLTYMQT